MAAQTKPLRSTPSIKVPVSVGLFLWLTGPTAKPTSDGGESLVTCTVLNLPRKTSACHPRGLVVEDRAAKIRWLTTPGSEP